MLRLTRRALLLVAFYLLTTTATAYAECAWVLWSKERIPLPGERLSEEMWIVVSGHQGFADCEAKRAELAKALVLFQLNIANTWYPRLQQRRRDGHTGAAASRDQDRAAAVAHQAQR